ncbi:serine protease [Mortierella sp. GBA30]|nr:serine protease [Mortierella sp. GBA30]
MGQKLLVVSILVTEHVRAKDQAPWVEDLHQKKGTLFVNSHGEKAGIQHVYDMRAFQGISGTFSRDVLDEIHAHPNTAYVEREGAVYMGGEGSKDNVRQSRFEIEHRTQTNAPYGLARISHRKRLTVKTQHRYEYSVIKPVKDSIVGDGVGMEDARTSVGEGKCVTVYLRARWGINFVKDETYEDAQGHGTHCAGIIASRADKVAKKAEVVDIRIGNVQGTGKASDLIAGLDYAVQAHRQRLQEESQEEAAIERRNIFKHDGDNGGDRRRQPYNGVVASISLRWWHSRTVNAAAYAAVEHGGLHTAVVAGNENGNACLRSHASSEPVITVGASTIEDERAWFSKYGPCVDVFAPGKDMDSAWIGSDTAHQLASARTHFTVDSLRFSNSSHKSLEGNSTPSVGYVFGDHGV